MATTTALPAPPLAGELPRDVRVAVVGAGFSGLGTAIRLMQAGTDDFVVLERRDDLGGTWRDNTYPGCACDVPSHLYSFSFAPNPEWSRTFSGQTEIWDYLRRCADQHGVTERVRFGHEVLDAVWDEDERRWEVETSQGSLRAQVLVLGTGGLSEPSIPDLPGLGSFEGAVFHSATWDHDHDLTGERVAVVGTGASAIQFVPQIQPRVGKLHLFQRTPPWIMPRPDRDVTALERHVYRALPVAQQAMRGAIYLGREAAVPMLMGNQRIRRLAEWRARQHLRSQVPDRELRRRMTPDYAIGCKRILISNDYFPAVIQPNVEVVSEGITSIGPRSVVAADSSEREVDTIIFGTGFHVTDLPIAALIRGRDGRSLAEVWQGSPAAYKGTAVAGYPNLFFMVGPNTALGHTSIVFMIESQIEYVAGALRAMRRHGAGTLEVRSDAQAAWGARIERMTEGTVWVSGGCNSYYIDRNGHNSTLWPTFTWPFRRHLSEFDEAAYTLAPPVREPLTAAA
jgi:cation diffusion facilitator CzcD-associated flavoprotein CzcO